MKKDYYEVLGVSKNATQEEIKKAYRALAHQHHPDKTGGSEAQFKEINEAYQTLKDPEKRRQYDQFGHTFEQARAQGGFGGFQGFSDFSDFARTSGFANLNEIFSDFFGGGFGGRSHRSRRGNDITVDLPVSFKEAVFGVKKEFELFRPSSCAACRGTGADAKTGMKKCGGCGGSGQRVANRQTFFGTFQSVAVCDTCEGRGELAEKSCAECLGKGVTRDKQKIEVTIPAGIEDGNTLRLTGQGEAIANGTSGDLFVTVHVQEKSGFARSGQTIQTEERVRLTDALLGASHDIETVDGTVELMIPPGTRTGDVLRLRGKGAPRIGGTVRGDHLVRIVIDMPKKLNRKQRKLVEGLREEEL